MRDSVDLHRLVPPFPIVTLLIFTGTRPSFILYQSRVLVIYPGSEYRKISSLDIGELSY